jgi:hypothetical protein
MAANNLALLLYLRGNLIEAEALLREVVAARLKDPGIEHQSTLTPMGNLANLLLEKGDPASAEPISRQVLAMRQKLLEPGHRQIFLAMDSYAEVLLAMGKAEHAEALARECLDGRRQSAERSAGSEAVTGAVIGLSLVARGQYDEAEPLLLNGATRLLATPAAPQGRTRRIVEGLIALYEARGTPDEVGKWREKRMDIVFPSYPFAP